MSVTLFVLILYAFIVLIDSMNVKMKKALLKKSISYSLLVNGS